QPKDCFSPSVLFLVSLFCLSLPNSVMKLRAFAFPSESLPHYFIASLLRLSHPKNKKGAAEAAPLPISNFHFPISASVQHLPQRIQRLPRQRIPRLDRQRLMKTLNRLPIHLFSQIRPSQIVVRKMPRLISRRFHRPLQPRNRLIVLIQLDQIRTNIVVRIPKLRIDFNRPLALRDRLIQLGLKVICPPQKSVRFRRRAKVERRLIEFDSALIVAFHLCLIGVLQHFPRARKGFLAHRHDRAIVASGFARVISTMVQRVCYVEPVLYAGKSRQKYTAHYANTDR